MVDQYSDRNVRRWLHRAAKVRAYQYRLTHLARFRQQCVAWDATPHCTRARPRHPASSRGGCASCDSAARPCRFVAPGQLKRRGPLTAEERKTLVQRALPHFADAGILRKAYGIMAHLYFPHRVRAAPPPPRLLGSRGGAGPCAALTCVCMTRHGAGAGAGAGGRARHRPGSSSRTTA